LMGAAATLVAVPGDSECPSTEVDELLILEVAGPPANWAASVKAAAVPVAGTVIGEVFRDRTPRRLDHLDLGVAGLDVSGPALVLPLRVTGAVAGVLVALRRAGEQFFTDHQLDMMAAFADQAALAWQLASSQRRMRELDVMTDRDRIARDLHDLAIQRLFATGMTLQSAGRFIEHEEAAERVVRAVDDLDETIKIIRSTIFGLRARDGGAGTGLRARVVRAVGEAAPVLGFAPSVRMEGLIDTDVPREIADQVVAVLSEALTNIARHAGAQRADVALETDGRVVRLTVADNGRGVPPEGRRSGLRNMAERAEQLGGTFRMDCPEGGGTTLVWRVPVGER